jgi:hypothetical protein
MTEEEWNALPLKERMKLGVARMCTWKACGQLVGTGKREEEWNGLPLAERMKLGAPAKNAEPNNVLWNRRYREFCQFKIDNGHWRVPRENKQMQDWVSCQKKAYQKGKMSLKRKKLMDGIGDFSGGMKAVLGGIFDKHTGGSQMIPESLDELDVTEDSFTSNDVLMGSHNIRNLSGNLQLKVAISKHMPDDASGGSKQISSLAKIVIDEIESLDPKGRFLELKPGNRCFRTLNRDRVIQLIKTRFQVGKSEKKQKIPKGCPVTTLR